MAKMARNKVAPEKPNWKTQNQMGKAQKKFKSHAKTEIKENLNHKNTFLIKSDSTHTLKPNKSKKEIAVDTGRQSFSNKDDSGHETTASGSFIKSRENIIKLDTFKKEQNPFFKRNNNKVDVLDKVSKKPFDKKKYRLKKYSKKYRVEQWEDKRKKVVIKEYYRSIKDEPKSNASRIYEQYDSDSEDKKEANEDIVKDVINSTDIVEKTNESRSTKKQPREKVNTFKKAQDEFHRIKEEKQKNREEFLLKKAEKKEALKKLKKEKAEKYRKLSRRTKKGQPIMKDRLEMLLEKIQKMN